MLIGGSDSLGRGCSDRCLQFLADGTIDGRT